MSEITFEVPESVVVQQFSPFEDPEVLDAEADKRLGIVHHKPFNLSESVTNPPEMRQAIIDGIVRRGEIVNINAPPKSNKSWMVMDLLFSVALGKPWLGTFPTSPGKVLLVDNELHEETLKNRVADVASAKGVTCGEIDGKVFAQCVRGSINDINTMAAAYFADIEPGQYDVIVLDAFYRFLPDNFDESDNGKMTTLYNSLDKIATELDCAIVLVHHTSKGNQGGKATTDVGSGAGSMARAADCHLAIRPHAKATAEQDLFVLTAAVRSFGPLEPVTLEFRWPKWVPKDIEPELAIVQTASRTVKRQEDELDQSRIAEKAGTEIFNASDVRKWLGCGDNRANRLIRILEESCRINAVGDVKRPRSKSATPHYQFKNEPQNHSEFEMYG